MGRLTMGELIAQDPDGWSEASAAVVFYDQEIQAYHPDWSLTIAADMSAIHLEADGLTLFEAKIHNPTPAEVVIIVRNMAMTAVGLYCEAEAKG